MVYANFLFKKIEESGDGKEVKFDGVIWELRVNVVLWIRKSVSNEYEKEIKWVKEMLAPFDNSKIN